MTDKQKSFCLNPCSNGICSLTSEIVDICEDGYLGLNPCSNGICSLTEHPKGGYFFFGFSLNPCSNGICSLTAIFDPLFEGEELS